MQAESIATSISVVCENALIIEDYAFVVEHNLKVTQENPHILYIRLIRRDGFMLIHTADRWTLDQSNVDVDNSPNIHVQTSGRIAYSELVQQRVFEYSHVLKYSIVPWGILQIGLSTDLYRQDILGMYRIMTLISLGCLAFGFIMAYGFAKKISRPIQKLQRMSREIACGNLDIRVHLTTRDEIGDLACSFNTMTEALQATTISKNFFNSIIENMAECLLVMNMNGIIHTVNPATLTLLGYAEHELLGQPLSHIWAEMKTARIEQWKDTLLHTGREQNIECMLRTKRGGSIPVLFSASMMQAAGHTRDIVCVALDIRSRKKAEHDLEQAYTELQETQAQLIQAAKLASIGELAAGVAHEINQPLMVIRTAAQFLEREVRRQRLELAALPAHLKPIERNTRRMMGIIEHLRVFSRQSPISFSAVNINQVIEDALLMIGEQLRLRDILVSKQLAPDLPPVWGNANQLEQVHLNLIINARDAIIASGNVPRMLSIFTQRSFADDNRLEILVKDTGSGISPKHLSRIFDPFFTTKEVGKGTGLGLSISYGIIKDHQGEIQVLETGPGGTTFEIALPITTDEMVASLSKAIDPRAQ